jgi:hypothetical protein
VFEKKIMVCPAYSTGFPLVIIQPSTLFIKKHAGTEPAPPFSKGSHLGFLSQPDGAVTRACEAFHALMNFPAAGPT